MIKITPEQLKIVAEILSKHVPGAQVRAFGSRVNGTPKPYSDLDLAIIAGKKLDIASLGALREAFAESDLPFRVDIIDWHSTSLQFKKIVEAGYEAIILPKT
ncbi:MAG: nucleotidyltransferase domain-containing protein [Elusimicrobiales bacterium]|nr:nucleotidyltransferase domain-containing protein [Elusimicrobiales bacterium]